MECISKEIRPLVTTPIKKELEKAEGLKEQMPEMAKRAEKLSATLEAIEALPNCEDGRRKRKPKGERKRSVYQQFLSDCFAEQKQDWLKQHPDGKMTWDDIQKYMKKCRESYKKKGA